MSYTDKSLTCPDCRCPFPYTAEDQGLSRELGFDEPVRCPSCRALTETARSRYPAARHSLPRDLHAAAVDEVRRQQTAARHSR